MDITVVVRTYLERIHTVLSEFPEENIKDLVVVLDKARRCGKRVYIFGNGGSAATASHFASDLNKGTISPGQRRFKALALTDSISLLTAWGNDSSYEDIFAQQIENHVEPEDIVIGISGSGKSMNVFRALELAKSKQAVTVALTGFDGGRIRSIVDHCLVVPNATMEQVEDVHLLLTHIVTNCLRAVCDIQ